jgi:hypothetical protein
MKESNVAAVLENALHQCKHIGMSADELLRLKQITGLASLFQNKEFSMSWNAESEIMEDEEGI